MNDQSLGQHNSRIPKNLGGPGTDLGGPVPPWPQRKTATGRPSSPWPRLHHLLDCVIRSGVRFLELTACRVLAKKDTKIVIY